MNTEDWELLNDTTVDDRYLHLKANETVRNLVGAMDEVCEVYRVSEIGDDAYFVVVNEAYTKDQAFWIITDTLRAYTKSRKKNG